MRARKIGRQATMAVLLALIVLLSLLMLSEA
jgi:hypothetical protein